MKKTMHQPPKKSTALRVLAAMLLLSLLMAFPALAEDMLVQMPIDYEGAWLSLPDQGFQLFMPMGWIVGPSSEGDGIALVDPETQRAMWIELLPGEGFSLDGVLEALKAAEGFTNVSVLHFGQIPFVTYSVPAQDMFGAATLSADNSTAFFFKFKPLSDAEYSTLTLKIMSTLSPVL